LLQRFDHRVAAGSSWGGRLVAADLTADVGCATKEIFHTMMLTNQQFAIL
jgi:hypothetical protein